MRSRRDLWLFLGTLPDEVLSRAVLPGPRFVCIKDLVLHIPAVEDSWIHEDILRDTPVWESVPDLKGARDGPFYAQTPLEGLLNYWRAVEESTHTYLSTLTPQELARAVRPVGSQEIEHTSVDGLLWHVMQHEVRHTAQIALLARQMGHAPPALDLCNYLPWT